MLVGSASMKGREVTPFPLIEMGTGDLLVESMGTGDLLTEGTGCQGIVVTVLGCW